MSILLPNLAIFSAPGAVCQRMIGSHFDQQWVYTPTVAHSAAFYIATSPRGISRTCSASMLVSWKSASKITAATRRLQSMARSTVFHTLVYAESRLYLQNNV